nr:MAG TPA_asm: hypothetical protein [Caudoviricetes sp.]
MEHCVHKVEERVQEVEYIVYKKWSIVYRMWKSIVEKIIVYRIIDVYTIQWYNRVEEMR